MAKKDTTAANQPGFNSHGSQILSDSRLAEIHHAPQPYRSARSR